MEGLAPPLAIDELRLKPNLSPGATAAPTSDGGWRLEIPPGPKVQYRLAQLDDYSGLKRDGFHWHPPVSFSLTARVSSASIPGTWGFGLWNDPFSLSLGFGGGSRHFPALPNAAWFFFASPQNYLSLRDDVPAQGFLVQTFRSPKIPASLLALGSIGLPMMAFHRIAKALRWVLRNTVRDESHELTHDPTQRHKYSLKWEVDKVVFQVDGSSVSSPAVNPVGRLGLVIWIDNQYLSYTPDGKLGYWTLAHHEPAWLEIKNLEVIRSGQISGLSNLHL